MTDDPTRNPDAPTFDPADNPTVDSFDSADDDDAPSNDNADPILGEDGNPVVDFATYDAAVAQADALGLDADAVEHVGTAFHVNAD